MFSNVPRLGSEDLGPLQTQNTGVETISGTGLMFLISKDQFLEGETSGHYKFRLQCGSSGLSSRTIKVSPVESTFLTQVWYSHHAVDHSLSRGSKTQR